MGVKTEYSEKMKMASKLLYEDEFYDFEPKSIWDYKKLTYQNIQ